MMEKLLSLTIGVAATLALTCAAYAVGYDARCTITRPNPTLNPGAVLLPVSTAGTPCFVEIPEGTINNVALDAGSGLEECTMDGEIDVTGYSGANPPCRWTVVATCKAESRVVVTGPGSPASPPQGNSDYSASAMHTIHAVTHNWGTVPPTQLEVTTVSAQAYIAYPNTGIVTAPAASHVLSLNGSYDHKKKVRLYFKSNSVVDLRSTRVEVELKGYAKQAETEWSGNMTAWAIGGDDVIPTEIVQSVNGQDAIWQVD
jgi:hypothetical protein